MKFHWTARRKNFEQGQTAPMFIILLAALILLVGLIVDTGTYALATRRAQIAIDSAALAAAAQLDEDKFRATDKIQLKPDAINAARDKAHFNYPTMSVLCDIHETRVDCVGIRPVKFLIFPSTTVVVRASAELQFGIDKAGDAGK